MRPVVLRLAAGAALVGALMLAGGATAATTTAPAPFKHVFVIMLENHSQSSVIDDANAPFITALAHTYGLADNYYGVTHPSLPNYVASISGSNWFVNDDNPSNTFDHTNLVDQLEAAGKTWGGYMESMPSAGFTGAQYPANAALYANKHNPFVLFDDVLASPARLAKVKPYTDLAGDLASDKVPDFVWITPNQCHDMHGGVYTKVAADGSDGTPCPYGSTKDDTNDAALKAKADAFVKATVDMIFKSAAWKDNSAIFVVTDENDYTGNKSTDGWETAAWCCDSPVLPSGYQFLGSNGKPDGTVWYAQPGPNGTTDLHYGGGLVPAIVIATHGPRHAVSHVAYNHYSMLRSIEGIFGLGYLGNASDAAQVRPMTDLLYR